MRELEVGKRRIRSLEKYQEMLDSAERLSQTGSFEWDLPRKQMHWSEGLYRIYGLDPRTSTATFEAMLERTHPDDRDAFERALDEAVRLGCALETEARSLSADGTTKILVVRGAVTNDEAGQAVKLSGACHDVTALKQEEERRRRLVERHRKNEARLVEAQRLARMGHWEWDLTTGRQRWSDGLYRVLGVKARHSEVTVQDFVELVHPDDLLSVRKNTDAVLAGKPQGPIEFRVLSPDGVERIISGEATLFRDTAGRPSRVVGTGQDITERKKADAERKEFVQELDAKNAELERFLYAISHDVMNPLVTISVLAGKLEQDAASGNIDQARADVGRIKEAAVRMEQLLNKLLELGRISYLFDPPEEVGLTCLAREAAELVAESIEERGVVIEIEPVMPVVCGDRRRLLEVYRCLIANAAKFMGDQTEPRITIGGRRDDSAVVCFVRDNGMGIDEQYHERVFGLFEQLNQEAQGTGIGLALAKRIVEMHGGRIWAKSEGLGTGTTIYFTLPVSTETKVSEVGEL